jgi:hypothetical protein
MNKLFVLLAVVLVLQAPQGRAQEIYRIVDEDGNVTYTDQKPSDDAEPVELPELNVLEGDADPLASGDEQAQEPSGMNFRIESPDNGATVPIIGATLDVELGIDIDFPETARVVMVLDGEALDPVRTLTPTIEMPAPGEHRLMARLETPGGSVLGTTPPVSFTTVAVTGN